MECLRCGNKDPSYFYLGHKGYYCRKCIGFSRVLLEEEIEPVEYEISKEIDDYKFEYKLTKYQLLASNKCAELIDKYDILLYCVCGAGKTEITVKTISNYLAQGKKVAYAISRKEVVIELTQRFSKIFNKAKVIGVYQNHHDELYGDLIVCTCHQLYRYHNTFDLLILDEVDAFPLKGNETLMNICLRSCKGHIIFSSATINDDLKRILDKRIYKKIELYVRPNNLPLVIPKVYFLNKTIGYLYLYKILRSMTNQCIIFVTNKKTAKYMYKIFSHLLSCTYVYSDLEDRNTNIIDFRNKKYKYIFSTSVLERGITIKDVNVVIMNYDFYLDSGSMIQMLGRLKRGKSVLGDGYIFTNKYTKDIKDTLKYLREANSYI